MEEMGCLLLICLVDCETVRIELGHGNSPKVNQPSRSSRRSKHLRHMLLAPRPIRIYTTGDTQPQASSSKNSLVEAISRISLTEEGNEAAGSHEVDQYARSVDQLCSLAIHS